MSLLNSGRGSRDSGHQLHLAGSIESISPPTRRDMCQRGYYRVDVTAVRGGCETHPRFAAPRSTAQMASTDLVGATMRGQHLFFATRNDLLPGLEVIESQWQLEYQLYEMRDDRDFVMFTSLLDAPQLGVSETGQCMSDDGYLVYPRDARPRILSIPQRRGGVKYGAELSGEIVQLLPGGVHAASGALVSGRVAAVVGASERGAALFRAFARTILRRFHRIRSYWVGPEAYAELRAGRRLATIGIRSPAEYDLFEAP